ncbi:hypothetical protein A9Q84_00045 [Halobacteriovorax marinus]|uniref:Uncharacterized protein n=1 Tax=Halobacteriovorax marinus TaxID=97084 RepID=A0A1Y5FDD5_9BACT|nr:hypothetical protein A9Q84_00045 [Halobacteriovorax marinus]
MSNNQASMIGNLSNKASNHAKKNKNENNPLFRENKLLKVEVETLTKRIKQLETSINESHSDLSVLGTNKDSEIESLKKHIIKLESSSIADNKVNDLNLQIKELKADLDKKVVSTPSSNSQKDSSHLISKIEELQEKNTLYKTKSSDLERKLMKLKDQTVIDSSKLSVEGFINLNLTANAAKFFKAIMDQCVTDDWYVVSGYKIKNDYQIHRNYFSDAREELVDKKLIEYKNIGKDGNVKSVEYRLLIL